MRFAGEPREGRANKRREWAEPTTFVCALREGKDDDDEDDDDDVAGETNQRGTEKQGERERERGEKG